MKRQLLGTNDKKIIVSDIVNSDFVALAGIEEIDESACKVVQEIVNRSVICDEELTAIDYSLVLLHWRSNLSEKNLVINHTVNDKAVTVDIGSVESIIEKVRNKMNFKPYVDRLYDYDIVVDLNLATCKDNMADILFDHILYVSEHPITPKSKNLDTNLLNEYLLTEEFTEVVTRFMRSNNECKINVVKFKDLVVDVMPVQLFEFSLSLLKTDMADIYDQMFLFINKLGSTHDHYMQATQKEVFELIERLKKDVEKQNQNQKGSVPGMPRMPSASSLKGAARGIR